MADILKISTPLVDRNNAVQQNRQLAETGIPFQMSETTKVVKTNADSEMLMQNNGLPPREEGPELLLSLLKDPGVTVSFLKNIYLLQEIINLIPVNNSTMSGEIQQLFDALLLVKQEIPGELVRQENAATAFKGELFDLLRGLVDGNDRPDLRAGVANLLKALSGTLNRQDILDSMSNSLGFLAQNLSSSKSLFDKLTQLATRFAAPDAAERFSQLKGETLQLMKEVEGSILFSPKLAKLLPMLSYNLSRFSDNPDHLQTALKGLLNLLDGREQRELLTDRLSSFLVSMTERSTPQQLAETQSKVMEALAKLIGKEAASEQLSFASAEKLEKIVHSLLSSPCNFTPLLHYIIPVEVGSLRSFAEMWIDPNEQNESTPKGGGGENRHLLIVIDVEGVGQFETELSVVGKKIIMNLLCPAAYLEQFTQMKDYAAKLTANTEYTFSEVYVGRLERSRSLMDVFKTLPHKRTGIDVKA